MRRLLAFALLALALVTAVGCGGDPQSSPPGSPAVPVAAEAVAAVTTTPPAQPKTEDAARAVAQEELDAYAAEDYGATWDLWTSAGQAAFSRENYAALYEQCPQRWAGIVFEIKDVRIEGDTAAVRVGRLGAIGTYHVRYEDGQWRWQPEEADLAAYALGLDALVTKRRADGDCAS